MELSLAPTHRLGSVPISQSPRDSVRELSMLLYTYVDCSNAD